MCPRTPACIAWEFNLREMAIVEDIPSRSAGTSLAELSVQRSSRRKQGRPAQIRGTSPARRGRRGWSGAGLETTLRHYGFE